MAGSVSASFRSTDWFKFSIGITGSENIKTLFDHP
jgi:hypothetical protein